MKVQDLTKWSKKKLLKLPERAWDDCSKEYDYIWLVPAGLKHDSGYMRVAIIGVCRNGKDYSAEICGWPDDISCHFPSTELSYDKYYPQVRMDCFYPNGVLQYHGRGKFKVSSALSSQDIYFTPDSK